MKVLSICFFLFSFFSAPLMGQEPTSKTDEDKAFNMVEQMPQFPGGMDALVSYLGQNINYPIDAQNKKVEGTVYITFVVGKKGQIQEARVLKGIGSGCDTEALRVVNNMPKWIPGRQKGRKVRVQFNLPISFRL